MNIVMELIDAMMDCSEKVLDWVIEKLNLNGHNANTLVVVLSFASMLFLFSSLAVGTVLIDERQDYKNVESLREQYKSAVVVSLDQETIYEINEIRPEYKTEYILDGNGKVAESYEVCLTPNYILLMDNNGEYVLATVEELSKFTIGQTVYISDDLMSNNTYIDVLTQLPSLDGFFYCSRGYKVLSGVELLLIITAVFCFNIGLRQPIYKEEVENESLSI